MNYLNSYLEILEDSSIPCPLCQIELDVRIDKNKKPYMVCDECQAQFFIRGEKGIERLCEFVDRPW